MTCICPLFTRLLSCHVLAYARTYMAEPTSVHKFKRARDAPRAIHEPASQDTHVRLATMGARALLTNVILPFHVVPRAFTTTLACTPSDDDDNDHGNPRCASRNSGVGDPFYIRPHATRTHARLGIVLFAVHQYVLTVRERGDARLWRDLRKDFRSWMAWMGSHGRNKRGTWYPLTKRLTTQMVVEKT